MTTFKNEPTASPRTAHSPMSNPNIRLGLRAWREGHLAHASGRRIAPVGPCSWLREASACSRRHIPIVVRMKSPGFSEVKDGPAWQRWLDKPQSGLVCVSSWVFSSAVFIGIVALFGGPTQNDAVESLYGTWA